MEYLYIPTSTLNFNNILSTGSISPAAFYKIRQFGYSQFEVVDPNPFKNNILLYNRYPEYVIEDLERDNHALVLRMRSDLLPHIKEERSGLNPDVRVFSYGETIYFDHTSVDFLFPTQESLRIAITKSEPSLTTKLVELFRPSMRVPNPSELHAFKWLGVALDGIKDWSDAVATQCCDDDDRINRLKGFASGYILGAYKSIDPKVARVRSHVRAIKNEVSAMLNDPSRRYPNSLRNDVEFSCYTLEQFFAEAGIGLQRFKHKDGDSIRIDNGLIKHLQDRHESGSRPTQFLIKLVNDYCLTSKFYGELDETRLNVAIEGSKSIRSLIGDRWEGSPYQEYINTLLNNIKSGNPFNFSGSNSLVIQSFAAFILKGDDLEKLEAFLTAHDIGDFRFSFALWGAMFGFSKLPKTLYNLPIQLGERSYAEQMHAYVHSVVHNISLDELSRPRTNLEVTSTFTAIRPAGEPQSDVIVRLLTRFPSSKSWLPKIRQLLQASGGLNQRFVTLLRKTQTDDLGGRIKDIRKKDVQEFFEDALKSQPLNYKRELPFQYQSCMSSLFVDDEDCVDDFNGMLDLSEEKRYKVAISLQEFQKKYRPGGYYSNKPLEYQRDNTNTVDHFIRCLLSERTKDLNVSLTGAERDAILRWLRTRYNC